jgi:YD repeat-containing protein
VRTIFPTTARPSSAGAATSNTSDYEAYSYDANGNRVTLRKRDGTTNLAYCYDALNRQTVKYLHTVTGCPTPTGSDVSTVYTLGGKPASAKFANGDGITYAYDSSDRLTGETTAQGGFSRQMIYAYDKANNRTSGELAGDAGVLRGLCVRPAEPSEPGVPEPDRVELHERLQPAGEGDHGDGPSGHLRL